MERVDEKSIVILEDRRNSLTEREQIERNWREREQREREQKEREQREREIKEKIVFCYVTGISNHLQTTYQQEMEILKKHFGELEITIVQKDSTNMCKITFQDIIDKLYSYLINCYGDSCICLFAGFTVNNDIITISSTNWLYAFHNDFSQPFTTQKYTTTLNGNLKIKIVHSLNKAVLYLSIPYAIKK